MQWIANSGETYTTPKNPLHYNKPTSQGWEPVRKDLASLGFFHGVRFSTSANLIYYAKYELIGPRF